MYKKAYKELAEKYDLPIAQVKAICESQFEFTKETIQKGGDTMIMLQYLGKFYVKPGKRAIMEGKRYLAKKALAARQLLKNDRREETSEDSTKEELHT